MKKKGLTLKLKTNIIDDDDFKEDNLKKDDPEDKIYFVVDKIYLSKRISINCKDYEGAKNKENMKLNGIKTVFNCATTHCDCLFRDTFDYVEHGLKDTPDADMSQKFMDIADEINQIIEKGNILIHCFKGISRAPSCVIAYLVKYKKYNPGEALDELQNLCSRVDPNAGFLLQLEQMHDRLAGKTE